MREKIIILFFGTFLLLNYFSWSFLFYLNSGDLKVVFFDVGQGDAIFIKTPDNNHILIDGGPGRVVLDKLKQEMPFFYNKIDLVILSHAHYDHVSGIMEVIDIYDIENIICNGAYSSQQVSLEWKKIIQERGYIQARAGQRVVGKDFYIDTLYPAEDFSDEKVDDLNNTSVISRFVFNDEYSFFFTGDTNAKQEKEVVFYEEKCEKEGGIRCDFFPIISDVLKVSHHGSKTSTADEFLESVSPRIAVIMAGEGNRHGHPHEEVLRKLEENGIKIKRTDQDGDIIFKIKK
jgi:competence protein ComEC